MRESSYRNFRTLASIQERTLEQQKRVLMERLADEARIEKSIRALEEQIGRNVSMLSGGSDAMSGLGFMGQASFREWLPRCRQQIEEKERLLESAKRQTGEIRLHVTKTAQELKATETMLDNEDRKRRAAAMKKEQNEMDELAAIRFVKGKKQS